MITTAVVALGSHISQTNLDELMGCVRLGQD
jgi:hypothetical protein